MLSNRYIIAFLVVLLIGVAGWNISFFYARRNAAAPHVPAARAAGGVMTGVVTKEKPAKDKTSVEGFPEKQDPFLWRRDPFRRFDVARRMHFSDGRQPAADEELSLKGVIISNGRPFALVNGWVVGIGDSIHDYKVSAIRQYSIQLKGAGGTKEISITNDKLKEN